MIDAAQIERRVDFALNSPDFWRGLGIAVGVLVTAAVIRAVIRVIRKPQERPLAAGRLAQISGLLSWLALASATFGYQITRLGETDWSWRLPVSLVGAFFGAVWAWGTVKAFRETRKKDNE